MAIYGVNKSKSVTPSITKKELTELHDKIALYEDFLDQFQTILTSDRAGTKEIAEQLDLKIAKNATNKDILSGIFSKMRAEMLNNQE